ncbi:MAG: guanine deaminase [Proteobacteria bacterium]|nr:guanine deaminase [Pseudomonadota bacterium]
MATKINAYRATIFHIHREPLGENDHRAYDFFEDGLLVTDHAHVLYAGDYSELKHTLPLGCTIHDRTGMIIMPGLIDTHVHYPQTDIIASHGKQLMDWLETYTFPCEKQFEDAGHSRQTAVFFIQELLKNGTTTAMVLGTVHAVSVQALFEKADDYTMRLVAGKVMMDRLAPHYLRDTAQSSYDESKHLIEHWHHKNRLTYAVTPRFALTSSEEQLDAAGALIREFNDVRLHTHLAENTKEVDLIAKAFPWSTGYLDVYNHFGLVCDRSVFAHCIYLSDTEFKLMKEKAASVSLCPTSNLFLGSGLFDLGKIMTYEIKTGLGSDVGGGTSFSMFKTMAEAYKVCQLKGVTLSPVQSFYYASLGAAKTLGLDQVIGNFEPGKEADFIVINPDQIPLLKRRISMAQRPEEILFALMILGDDRMIYETYVNGVKIPPLT